MKRDRAVLVCLLVAVGVAVVLAVWPVSPAPLSRPTAAPRLSFDDGPIGGREQAPEPTSEAAGAGSDVAGERVPVGPRTLFGSVRNRLGEPVGGALLVLDLNPDSSSVVAQLDPLRTRSMADGSYRVGLPAVSATRPAIAPLSRVTISARGYATRSLTRPPLEQGPRAVLDVVLDDQGGIRGLVLGPDGPVSDASVSVYRTRPENERRPLAYGRTDLDGRFSLPLPEVKGPLRLRARHPAQGETAEVVDGAAEIVLRLPGGGFIEGRVVDPQREPIQSFTVTAASGEDRWAGAVSQSFDSGRGEFRLGPVAPGERLVVAIAEGFQPANERKVNVVGGETVTGVELVLSPSGELTGRVLDASTRRPIEGALIAPAELRMEDLAASVGATTGSDGVYVLRALPGKRSSIQVTADGYRPYLGGGVDVRPGRKQKRDFDLTPLRPGEASTSELTGIGAVLAGHAEGVLISSLVDGGPASRSLKEGDLLLEIDGRRTAGMNLGDAANLIRGELGTDVQVLVRHGSGQTERLTLRRERVEMPERSPRRRRPDNLEGLHP